MQTTLEIPQIGEIKVRFNRRASRIRLTIKEGHQIILTMPVNLRPEFGLQFVEEKKEWIVATLEKQKRAQNYTPKLKDGLVLKTPTYEYHVRPSLSSRTTVQVNTSEGKVYFEYPTSLSLTDPGVMKWLQLSILGMLRKEAELYLPQRLRYLSVLWGYSYNQVRIKNNKTNWGSCSSKKNINLNLQLMRLSERQIDYVLVHELVHTRIMNHGDRFRETMLSHFPDMDILEKEIKKQKVGLLALAES